MKILSLATVRTGNEIPDPIVCAMSSELSSFGFFQRPVSRVELNSSRLVGELEAHVSKSEPSNEVEMEVNQNQIDALHHGDFV